MKKRITALVLSFVLILSVALTGCGKKSVTFDEQLTMTPLNADAMQNYFMYNPDRGFRTHNVIRVQELTQYVGNKTTLLGKIGGEFNIYFQNLGEPCSLSYCYIYFTPWVRTELPSEALEVVKAIFEYARIKKIKLLVSFCYNDLYHEAWYSSDDLRQKMEGVCADENTILKHIDQLAPVIAEYKDCCFTIKNGFIGFVGEWAYPYQYPEVDYDKISRAIVDKLCIPNDLYFSHRLPRYTVSVKEAYPDWDGWKKIGFNNCAFFGEQTRENWESEHFQIGHKDGWWEYICENGAYFPVSGELFTSTGLNNTKRFVKGNEAILELAHHWHTILSFYHGRYDVYEGQINIMENWEREDLGHQWLDAQGIIYDPNWFLDDDGNTVVRNCYEFIRDHLGYKLVAEKVKMDAADGKIAVSMDFKNYGFSAAFNLKSGFAILDENFNPISEVEVGDPEKWYSHDPENWKSTEVLDHSLSAELDAPTESGKYYVAFFLRNLQGVGAQLSNEVIFENNYNILHTFEA